MREGPLPLTAFADEISPDLDTQVSTLQRLSVQGLDLRSVGGVNVLELSEEALIGVREACKTAGLSVQSVGSPVNKVRADESLREGELRKLQRAIHAAKALGVPRIRIFSPEGEDWGQIRPWMAEQVALAQSEDVVLIHENDARFYGAFPENAHRLFEEFGGPHFRAVFDFANTVLLGFRPRDWFPWLLPHLDTLHIKDAKGAEGRIVPAGEGDGDIRETLAILLAEGWRGPLTLEPHLQAGGPYGGFSGEELFEVAVTALRKVLEEVGQPC